ncbi:MAG: tetratricopeptide repeat protein [Proteobacteria bacterium]|nr:tetratricopeptide repeat protein [Pseudomonadota bacterium]
MAAIWGELKRRNVVRVAVAYAIVSWLLLQLTDVLMPLLGLPEWVDRLVFLLLVIGFPLALIFAWAFELTPEGLKKEKDVDRSESNTPITGRKLDFAIIAVLAVALVFFASTHQWNSETGHAETADKSIAVLAFTDLSPEGNQEYFSDGISEELLNVLAKIPGLRVAARTSSFKFKGENRDIIDIGEQLDVALVLEGSVRKAGAQIRITAQLVDASNGFHLWSETYDRELKNIFAVQDEISAAIVNALKDHLGLQVEAAPRVIAAANTEAHEAYLRGRYLMVQGTRATIEGAVREFQKAITLDPEYALAHAELAMATLKRGGVFLNFDLTVTEAIARAAPHAERAMALDPTLAEAHAATGFLLWRQENLEGAQTHFRQAIKINPNYSIVYLWMGNLLNWQLGRYKEGFATYETMLRLDPLSIPTTTNYVMQLTEMNRLDEADRELEKLASIAPGSHAFARAYRASLGGKWANAVLGYLDALRIDPQKSLTRRFLTFQLAAIGLEKEAVAISEAPHPFLLSVLGKPEDAVTTAQARLAEAPNSLAARSDLGLALAGTGDYAGARPILEEMWQRSGGRVTRFGLFQTSNAQALIAIRRAAGEEAKVGELVAAIKDNVRRYRAAGIIRARQCCSVDYEAGFAAYLAGERESGLALIGKAAEDGFFIPPKEAYLQSLYDDPGFAPIRASQEARQARERKRFLDVVCTDNPYAAVWQPEDGTCEQFAAADGN